MMSLPVFDLAGMLEELAPQDATSQREPSTASTSVEDVKPLSRLGQKLAAARNQNIAALEDALSYISPDVPRGNGSIIGPDGAPVSDYWFGCLLAARREYGDAAKETMRRWSQQSPRYGDGEGFEHAWAQYDPNHRNPVGIGSLFMLAKAFGWQDRPSAAPPTPHLSANRFRLLDRAAIMAIQPIQWRVKGLLPATGIAAIFGPSGSGKSFLAKDLGANIALGQDWFGHRTTRCHVTYVMLEGEGGLRNRVAA
jgi:hypothetical protein